MDNISIDFSLLKNENLKKELEKLCRKIDIPLRRRSIRLFIKRDPPNQLPGGAFFCDFTLFEKLFNCLPANIFAVFTRLPLTIQQYFARKEKKHAPKNTADPQKTTNHFDRTFCFYDCGNPSGFDHAFKIESSFEFLAALDAIILRFYDSRGFLRESSGKIFADENYMGFRSDNQQWQRARTMLVTMVSDRFKNAENKLNRAIENIETAEKDFRSAADCRRDSERKNLWENIINASEDLREAQLNYSDALKDLKKSEPYYEEHNGATALKKLSGVDLRENPFCKTAHIFCAVFNILAFITGTIFNTCGAFIFWGFLHLLSVCRMSSAKINDWNSENQWRVTRGFSIGLGYFVILFGIIWASTLYDNTFLQVLRAFLIFLLVCVAVAALTRPLMDKIFWKALIFCGILFMGVSAYQQIYSDPSVIKIKWDDRNMQYEYTSVPTDKPANDFFSKCTESMAVVNSAIGSFFPSRGEYDNDSTDRNELLYFLFHLLCYIFFGYFAMALFGQRIINRIRFSLVPEYNKYFIWCNDKIGDHELALAKSINQQSDNELVCFSVSEDNYMDNAKELFRDMNFRLFGVKLRKREQIHRNALSIPEHFFITDDTAWNLNMAEHFLRERSKFNEDDLQLPPVSLYILTDPHWQEACEIMKRDFEQNNMTDKIIFFDRKTLIINCWLTNSDNRLKRNQLKTEPLSTEIPPIKIKPEGCSRPANNFCRNKTGEFEVNPAGTTAVPAPCIENMSENSGEISGTNEPLHWLKNSGKFSADSGKSGMFLPPIMLLHAGDGKDHLWSLNDFTDGKKYPFKFCWVDLGQDKSCYKNLNRKLLELLKSRIYLDLDTFFVPEDHTGLAKSIIRSHFKNASVITGKDFSWDIDKLQKFKREC